MFDTCLGDDCPFRHLCARHTVLQNDAEAERNDDMTFTSAPWDRKHKSCRYFMHDPFAKPPVSQRLVAVA